MADYISKGRSNYFKVNDEEALRRWAAAHLIEVESETRHGETYFWISPEDNGNGRSWPTETYNSESDEPRELDLAAELAAHLEEGSVAVLMESGSTGLQQISGFAIAVNSKGETVKIDIFDIYEAASHLGTEITAAVN